MTTTEAKTLKPGDAVLFRDRSAMVVAVRSNGVTVGYTGTGDRAGQFFTERVSAARLSRP